MPVSGVEITGETYLVQEYLAHNCQNLPGARMSSKIYLVQEYLAKLTWCENVWQNISGPGIHKANIWQNFSGMRMFGKTYLVQEYLTKVISDNTYT